MIRHLSLAVLVLGMATVEACPQPSDEIEVKVLAILASEHNKEVNPKLAEFAKQVQKKEPGLIGFKLDRSTAEKLKLGETKKFRLSGDEVVEVTVNKERNEQGRITLTIKPPKMNQITYECVCDKFFSMATDHSEGKGKDKTQLFIAIMAKPCGAGKK
jgi:hypothetical protein